MPAIRELPPPTGSSCRVGVLCLQRLSALGVPHTLWHDIVCKHREDASFASFLLETIQYPVAVDCM